MKLPEADASPSDPPGSWVHGSAKMVLNSLADGVYVTDNARRIVVWNRAAERITGRPSSGIIGSSCFDDILAHEDIDGNRLCGEDSCPLHRAITSGESSTVPQILFARTRDGRRIPVAVSVAPVRNESGAIVGGVESFRDLSELVQDLRRGRAIQEHAMQATLPADPRVAFQVRNLPQEYVSGDFCRVEQVQPGRYGIMLADVMGHGVAAALHTMQIRSLWEEARDLLCRPGRFMTHLNEKLFRLAEGEDFFATAFYGMFDAERKVLEYVTAGHPPPLLFGGRVVAPLPGQAVALGLLEKFEYTAGRQPLSAGDVVLIYSDGVVETVDGSGHELGWERLTEWAGRALSELSLDAALDRILHNLRDYGAHLTFQDDVSFISMAVR